MTPVAATIAEVRSAVAAARSGGLVVGLVPTMGALHAGHAALIRECTESCGFVVVSVFVNPTQFGPNEDFARYPRTLDADRALSADAGASLVFAPSVEEIYPGNDLTTVTVGRLGDGLCGRARPGHFDGVCTVVLKLFNIVAPDVAVFGAKDFQQARIIRQMVRDLNVPVGIRVAATVREADGLAMSSRNRYLAPTDRASAPAIYQGLLAARNRAASGERDVAVLEAGLEEMLRAIPNTRVEYARILDAETLAPIDQLVSPAVAAVAVRIGDTRLIDNIMIH